MTFRCSIYQGIQKFLSFFKINLFGYNIFCLEIFLKSPANADLQGEQKTSYNLALNFSKKGKPYCICEEVIVPALEEAIRNEMKTNPDPVLKSVPLSASTVKRRIDEMAHNVEKSIGAAVLKFFTTTG